MRPLEGALVLDLADEPLIIAGRYLADLGVRTIRIEDANGDYARRAAPWLGNGAGSETGGEHGLRHLLYNQGKESLALDLDSAEAWAEIERLAASADAVIAPMAKNAHAAAAFARLGAAAEAGAEGAPSIIDIVFRRGQEGTDATDLIAMAAGGQLVCNGFPDLPPDYPAGKLACKQASYLAVAASVAAILQRLRGGGPVRSEISLQEAVISTIIQAANPNLYLWHGMVAERTGTGGLRYPVVGSGFGAFEQGKFEDGEVVFIDTPGVTYRTGDDRWVTYMQSPTNTGWDAFPKWYAEVTGDETLLSEPWTEQAHRVAHRSEMQQFTAKFCAAQERDALVERAQGNGDLGLPVQTAIDIAADEHLHARGFFPQVPHPQLDADLTLPRSPYRSSAWQPQAKPAPALDAHGPLERDGGITAPLPAMDRGGLPLAGVRVLDFCWMAAGPLVTELLANLGADVIKIESASGLDSVREFSHPPKGFTIDTGAFFNDTNTDKRSITLNLHSPRALELIREALPRFDVVTSNFAPGAMEKFGLSYDALRAIKPDLIYASFPVMGSSGPKRGWRGIGNGVTALSGIAGHTGRADRPPIGIGTLHTDFTLCPIGASLIMAALVRRARTGEGEQLEIAQYEAAVHLLDHELIDALANGADSPRIGNRSREYAPHGLFPAAGEDEWLALAVRDEADWAALCDAAGLVELARRDDLRTLAGRKAAEDEIDEAIAAWSAGLDRWRAAALLQERGVPASAVETAADMVDGDAGAQPLFFRFQRGEVPFMVQHQPFTWNGARLGTRPSPELGEHNETVIKGEWGVDDERYVELLLERAIF